MVQIAEFANQTPPGAFDEFGAAQSALVASVRARIDTASQDLIAAMGQGHSDAEAGRKPSRAPGAIRRSGASGRARAASTNLQVAVGEASRMGVEYSTAVLQESNAIEADNSPARAIDQFGDRVAQTLHPFANEDRGRDRETNPLDPVGRHMKMLLGQAVGKAVNPFARGPMHRVGREVLRSSLGI
ncbi:MAG: hypothetical protein ACOYNI_09845 [Acidimicrobiia bacterium]